VETSARHNACMRVLEVAKLASTQKHPCSNLAALICLYIMRQLILQIPL
jgi:hypothetical protein